MVIECNLRASRSFPFVSKIFKVNFIDLATRVIMDRARPRGRCCRCSIWTTSASRRRSSRSRASTAPIPCSASRWRRPARSACLGEDFDDAFLKALLSVGFRLPIRRVLLSTGPVEHKAAFLASTRRMAEAGVELFGTHGTAAFMAEAGIAVHEVFWPLENRSPNALELVRESRVDLVINIPKDASPDELTNDYTIRRAAVDHGVPLVTNLQVAQRLARALSRKTLDELEIRSWREY